jgi:hypothetical protein
MYSTFLKRKREEEVYREKVREERGEEAGQEDEERVN